VSLFIISIVLKYLNMNVSMSGYKDFIILERVSSVIKNNFSLFRNKKEFDCILFYRISNKILVIYTLLHTLYTLFPRI